MKELNENTFALEIMSSKKALVFFYREKGCSFCDKMKAPFEQLAAAADFDCFRYALGSAPDSVATKELVTSFPTFAAYVDGKFVGKRTGAMPIEKVLEAFDPEPAQNPNVPVEQMPLVHLLADEAALIDLIFPVKQKLLEIQAEIKRRRETV
jgi:thiol-disulfide isomerase/thioredoxin